MSMLPSEVSLIAAELQRLQRKRAIVIKSRVMQSNRLQAVVAGTLGYSAGMPEAERCKKMFEAGALIKAVVQGTGESELASIILCTQAGIEAFDTEQAKLEKAMKKAAQRLPVAKWVEQEEQRGFGLLFLAIVIGETGDLARYANPAKVWRRMGCAPWQFDGKTLMGATWRGGKEGKLPAAEWEAFGYSPRRRSIAYLIGEGAVKQNKSVYRARYDEGKALIKTKHPDYSDLRCHRHGMLLATKLLLKRLWCMWNGQASIGVETSGGLPA